MARNLIDDDLNNLWPEFLKFLFDLAQSPNPELKEIALHLFRLAREEGENLDGQIFVVIHDGEKLMWFERREKAWPDLSCYSSVIVFHLSMLVKV